MSSARVLDVRPAGEHDQVVTVQGNASGHRREPCGGCPWRVDNTGSFPAEAFRLSARTAYDMAEHVFSCHESGAEKPAICAGFLLRGAQHNLSVRLRACRSGGMPKVHDGGCELHESYAAMAVANGVDPQDPVLAPCR